MVANTVELSFCVVKPVNDFIVEVIPAVGAEVAHAQLQEYHRLYDELVHPVGVMVNRKHSYSYSFEALLTIASHPNMAAVAVLLPDASKKKVAEYDISISKCQLAIRIFLNRDEALVWLQGFRPGCLQG